MATEITMPKLSDTMTEGLFAGWKKRIGDRIERGEIIAEVETDKAVMELEAFASGILIKTIVNGGENVPVGTVLGLIGEEGETAGPAVGSEPGPATSEKGPAAAAEAATQPGASPVAPASESSPGEPQPEPPVEPSHEKASPLVRRLAREQGIDLEKVNGSGPDGRITQDDLTAFVKQQQGEPETGKPSAPEAPATSQEGTQTRMRKAIANTVTQSWQTIPHFSVTVEIGMETCREVVAELKEGMHPIGYNALIIKASAVALQKFPLLRSGDPASTDTNISFAVSKPDGLLMPVIRQCQKLSVAEIESESVRLAERSRAGQLASEEMAGGTFSISNLGMYGVDEFTALIIPGQTAILAVGAVRERAVVQSGCLTSATTLRVTLCCDHRSVDGAYAASFLAELRALLEKPVLLLM